MTGVVLFGGTTEGRQLAQALDSLCAARGLPLTVFVATEYGQEVLPALTHGQVHTGRLAPEAMADQMVTDGRQDNILAASNILQSWWSAALVAGVVICAFIGAAIGKKIVKKHLAA